MPPGRYGKSSLRQTDHLLARSVCAAGRPACAQASRCIGLSGSDREFPALTGRSGTQRARRLRSRATVGTSAPWCSSPASELRITRVFSCVARGFKACPSFMFVGCCWWRSLAIDGGSGTSRGHGYRMIDPLLRRSVCAAGQPACPQVSRCTGLSASDRDFPALTGRSGTQRARWPQSARRLAPR
jgi:hypothetical protein